jgi:hypothetical protein
MSTLDEDEKVVGADVRCEQNRKQKQNKEAGKQD